MSEARPAPPALAFNPRARVSGQSLGHSRSTLVVIDDVLLNADAVRDYGCSHATFGLPAVASYPGLNAPVPESFTAPLAAALRPLLRDGFGVPSQQAVRSNGYFGLVTLKPGDLSGAQVIPHADRIGHQLLASVLYLCEPRHGGTAFFRHRRSGVERIIAENAEAYNAALEADHAQSATPQTYVDDDHPLFERIGHVEARYNRLVVYNGNLLHSGMIDPAQLSDDPRQGRLTLNIFIAPAA